MRKQASSWLIRFTMGAIIVTFIFFFGYSSYRKGMRGGRVGAEGAVAAKVDGYPVSESEFEFFYNRNLERFKQSFKDQELPDFARKMAQSSTVSQLVAREVTLIQADELGIVVPDVELAEVIRNSMAADQGGEFDPIAYRHQFLPYFKSRFGMDYESLVRQDLRAQSLESLFFAVDNPAPKFADDENPKAVNWTFESVTLDPNALVEAGLVKSTDEAKGIAEKLASSKDWKKILKPLKVDVKKIGPLTMSERIKLLDGQGTLDVYKEVFQLTKENPTIAKPIERGGKIYVLRLAEKIEKDAAENESGAAGSFYRAWLSKLIAKAKVKTFLESE